MEAHNYWEKWGQIKTLTLTLEFQVVAEVNFIKLRQVSFVALLRLSW